MALGYSPPTTPWLRYLTIDIRARVEPFAELGVMFLLFLIGIEMSVERLWSLRRFVAGIGSVQFLLSRSPWRGAVAPGRIGKRGDSPRPRPRHVIDRRRHAAPEEQGRTATPLGHVAIAVLLFQDLMVAPVLFGVEILGRGGDVVFGLARALLVAVVAIAVIVVAGRFATRLLFSVAGRTGSRELIMAMLLLSVIGIATATGAAGRADCAGRLPGRRAAVGNRIPSSGRNRHRAVQGTAGRPVLHHRRHVDPRPRGLERDREASC